MLILTITIKTIGAVMIGLAAYIVLKKSSVKPESSVRHSVYVKSKPRLLEGNRGYAIAAILAVVGLALIAL